MRNTLKLNENFWFGLVFLVFSIALYMSVTTLPQDVALFPKVILIVMGLTSVSFIIKSTTASGKESTKEKLFNLDLIIMIIALITTYGLLNILGFYVSGTLLAMFVFIFIDKSYNKNSYIKGVILSLVIMSVLYFIFKVVMNLITPEGLFF